MSRRARAIARSVYAVLCVVVGAFSDGEVKRIINMPEEEQPLYIMPVGRV